MIFQKFGKNDLFYNQVKSFPEFEFLIFDSKVYINKEKHDKGKFSNLKATPQGFISLYELNIDRVINTAGSSAPPSGSSIYPFVTKNGARTAFRTVSTSEFDSTDQYAYGDIIKGTYPSTASIKRTRFSATDRETVTMTEDTGEFKKYSNNKKFIFALRNVFDSYSNLSPHYIFSTGSKTVEHWAPTSKVVNWNKGLQEMSLIEVPSLLYGSSIDKGSVVLQFYYTGSLVAELRDSNRNGELIQFSGSDSPATNKDGEVAGVVLYDQGFIALTGSWTLNGSVTDKYVGTDNLNPKWKYFGVGANDGTSAGNNPNSYFVIKYKGTNYIPTLTMFAHMPKNEFNNSYNLTALSASQNLTSSIGPYDYRQYKSDIKFQNLPHSDYVTPTGSFKKTTYVSKVGIYDDKKRLIAIAKLATPIRKTEDREYTFKLKMDF